MKRLSASFLIITIALVCAGSSIANAAISAGTKCPKANVVQQYKGFAYTCLKLGKSMYWSNGVKVVTPIPKVTVTASPKPAPTVTITATPTPTPVSTKAMFPSTLQATIKFTGGPLSYSSWGDGLSHLYCDIPADAPKQAMFPNYSVSTVNWAQTNMKLYDGTNRLLGIASSPPTYQHYSDGSCSVTFTLSDLVLSQGPLTFQTGGAPKWIVPFSSWSGGQVTLNGDNTVIRYG
jgi:hypothetical protein